MKDGNQARLDLDRALSLNPGLHEALAVRASMRAANGDRDGTLADLAALDAGLPSSAHLREQMASLYVGLDLVPEALRQWELWVPTHRADARLARVLNERCWLRARLNRDLKLALEDCKAAVDKDRGEAAYHDSLGWTWLRLDDARRAVEAFDAAIKIKPGAFSHYGRALARQRLGEADAARRDLAAARQLDAGIDGRVGKEGFPVAAMADGT